MAIGPAATTAARERNRLKMKLSFFSASVITAAAALIRHARGIVIAEELYVTAERNRGKLPARSIAVVEADDFGTESDRKDEHPDAAKAGHQEMTKLVEENDDGQDKQEGHNVADDTAAECTQAPHNLTLPLRPSSRP